MTKGTLYGVGVGPGDPELITVKALKAIEKADIIAFHQTRRQESKALAIAKQYIDTTKHRMVPLTYPITTEENALSKTYYEALDHFYIDTINRLKESLDIGHNIAVLTEGDPSFYSSFMYILDGLKGNYHVEVIPGVSSVFAAAAAAQTSLCYRNETFTVLSAVLPEEQLVEKLNAGDAFAILKIGRNFTKVRNALKKTGLEEQAYYIEWASHHHERILSIDQVKPDECPYFSIVLVPGSTWREQAE